MWPHVPGGSSADGRALRLLRETGIAVQAVAASGSPRLQATVNAEQITPKMFVMSTTRAMPGGWVDRRLLPKGPNGRNLCRWCNLEVPKVELRSAPPGA